MITTTTGKMGAGGAANLGKYLKNPKPAQSKKYHGGEVQEERNLASFGHLIRPPIDSADVENVVADFESLVREVRGNKKMPKHLGSHRIFSYHPDDKVTADMAIQDAISAITEVRGENTPYFLEVHGDTDHLHVHAFIGELDLETGKVYREPYDYKKWEAAMRRIELERGYKVVPSSSETLEKAPTSKEVQMTARTGIPSTKEIIKATIKEICTNNPGIKMPELFSELHAVGVEVKPHIQSTGRLSGLVYSFEGETFKASNLGKLFTPKGLIEKLGVDYEQDRDSEAIRAFVGEEQRAEPESISSEPQSADAFEAGSGAAGRDRTQQPSGQAVSGQSATDVADTGRGVGRTDREPFAVHGSIERDDQPEPVDPRESASNIPALDRQGGWAGGRSAEGDIRAREQEIQDRKRQLEKRKRELEEKQSKTRERERALYVWDGGGRSPDSNFGGLTDLQKLGVIANPEGEGMDMTRRAVERQIKGMGGNEFQVGIMPPKNTPDSPIKPQNRMYTGADLMKSLGYLRSQNAKGAEIYIRKPPHQEHDLILMDDLTRGKIDTLTEWGFKPAVVTETSPDNFQAWIKLDAPASMKHRQKMTAMLGEKIGADPNSFSGEKYGRLAGFTNNKPEHKKGKLSPFAKLISYAGVVAEKARELWQAAQQLLAKDTTIAIKREVVLACQTAPIAEPHKLGEWFEVMHLKTQEHFKQDYNASIVDWQATVTLAEKGLSPEWSINLIEEHSPNLMGRKADVDDYVTRTVGKAYVWQGIKAENPSANYKDYAAGLLEKARGFIEAIKAPKTIEHDEISSSDIWRPK